MQQNININHTYKYNHIYYIKWLWETEIVGFENCSA